MSCIQFPASWCFIIACTSVDLAILEYAASNVKVSLSTTWRNMGKKKIAQNILNLGSKWRMYPFIFIIVNFPQSCIVLYCIVLYCLKFVQNILILFCGQTECTVQLSSQFHLCCCDCKICLGHLCKSFTAIQYAGTGDVLHSCSQVNFWSSERFRTLLYDLSYSGNIILLCDMSHDLR